MGCFLNRIQVKYVNTQKRHHNSENHKGYLCYNVTFSKITQILLIKKKPKTKKHQFINLLLTSGITLHIGFFWKKYLRDGEAVYPLGSLLDLHVMRFPGLPSIIHDHRWIFCKILWRSPLKTIWVGWKFFPKKYKFGHLSTHESEI